MDLLKVVTDYGIILLEILGTVVIVSVTAVSSILALSMLLKCRDHRNLFKIYRHSLAKGILLGLELFVAADIIYTVAIEMTYKSVAVLTIVVLIRTFLSFTLEVEMTGYWPWQNKTQQKDI